MGQEVLIGCVYVQANEMNAHWCSFRHRIGMSIDRAATYDRRVAMLLICPRSFLDHRRRRGIAIIGPS